MTQKTILNERHRALGAKMVDFGGWDMPLHYGSQVDEHHLVRRDAGMFDVSHMTVVDLKGARVREFLRQLVANSVDKLKVPGKALYTTMLNPQGGVIDDLIVYLMPGEGAEASFRLVVNAATREKDLAWINAQAQPFGVGVTERDDFAMVAVQGPTARERVLGLLDDDGAKLAGKLGKFAAAHVTAKDGTALFVARTIRSAPQSLVVRSRAGTLHSVCLLYADRPGWLAFRPRWRRPRHHCALAVQTVRRHHAAGAGPLFPVLFP